jgi:hypothetical protein
MLAKKERGEMKILNEKTTRTRITRLISGVAKAGLLSLSAAALLTFAPSAKADLVTNGSFESNGGNGQVGFDTSITDWSVPAPSGSYTFLFAPGTADTSGANGQYGNVTLWGPGNGVANGLPATSPDGGYFIGADSTFQQGAISQTINGLTVGATYQVGFYWAAAQQGGFTSSSFDQWQVSLGSDTQSTQTVNIPSQGFSGWMYQTFDYTATSTSEVLSFFASGGPGGVPPFALLDGVSMNVAAPEPEALALMGTVLAGLAFARRQQLKKRS